MSESGAPVRKLLVVEDDPGLQTQLKWAYEDYAVLIAGDHDAAIDLLRAEEPDVVTLDLGLPPDPDGTREGFRTLKTILEIKPDTKVIVVSGHGERASALTAIANGAWDFYQKPIDIDELGLIVRRAFHVRDLEVENARLASEGSGDNRVLGGMITGAPERHKVARTIERVANLDVSVMLLGASGITDTSRFATRSIVRATLCISGAPVIMPPSTRLSSLPSLASRAFSTSRSRT